MDKCANKRLRKFLYVDQGFNSWLGNCHGSCFVSAVLLEQTEHVVGM